MADKYLKEHPYLDKLREKVGSRRIEELLGVGNLPSTLSTHRVRPCHELAARQILGEQDPERVLVVRVPHDKISAVDSFLSAIGVSWTELR